MNTMLSGAATLYSLLFVGAALGKLDAWGAWRSLCQRIAPQGPLQGSLRVGLPGAEVGVAVVAFLRPPIGLVFASALLAAFAAGVWLLAPRLSGEKCHCFGAMTESSLDRRLAIRNLLLAIVAGVLAVSAVGRGLGPPSLPIFILVLLGSAAFVVALEGRRFLLAGRADQQAT